MSWAARRKTSRKEDTAYCLLGIFNVNMPLICGESEKAFSRLQLELIRATDDESIFAWTVERSRWQEARVDARLGMLAPSPECFANSGNIFKLSNLSHLDSSRSISYAMTNKGLELQILDWLLHQAKYGLFLFPINCYGGESFHPLAISILHVPGTPNVWCRGNPLKLEKAPSDFFEVDHSDEQPTTIYVKGPSDVY